MKNFLADIPLEVKPTPSVSMHCDFKSVIAVTKNKTFNEKSRHIRLRHNVVKQLFKDRIISIDYAKSQVNLVEPLTKPLARKQILDETKANLILSATDENQAYAIGVPIK